MINKHFKLLKRMIFMLNRVFLIFMLFSSFNVYAQLNFEETKIFSTAVFPNYMQIGDIDDDSKDDVLIASQDANFVTVLTKASDFTPMNLIIGEKAPRRGISWGDYNNDGNTDLAITDYDMDRISILYGAGQGSFSEPTYFQAGSGPVDITSLDYDSDGDIDVAVANNQSETITILANDGSGTFSSNSTINVQSGPETVESNDLNGDNLPDLLIVNNISNTISILFGSGSGSFENIQNYTLDKLPTELQVSDFNSDNIKDIVVVHDALNSISILYGKGGNQFDDAIQVDVSLSTSGGVFTTADLNEDGFTDIAINANNDRKAMVLLNDGLGNFEESLVDFSGSGGDLLSDVIAADLFDTGHIGLVMTNTTSIQIVGLVGDGTGIFSGYHQLNTSPSPYRLTSDDFNNDGYTDIAIANFFVNFISIFLNDTQEGFHDPININTTTNMHAINSTDIDKDGYVDILAGGFSELKIFYGDDSFDYKECIIYDHDRASDFSISDFNEDGHLDISTLTTIYVGDGNRGFSFSQSSFDPNIGVELVACDLNNDKHLDRVLSDFENDRVVLHKGKGDGTFEDPEYINVGDGPRGIAKGFFNEDEIEDIAVANFLDGTVSVIMGSSGDFLAHDSPSSGDFPDTIHSADINNDQTNDLLLVVNDKISILLGDGMGNFDTEEILETSFNPQDIDLADINNDGSLDIIVGSNSNNSGLSLHMSVIITSVTSKPLDEIDLNVSIYPNPTTEKISVAFSESFDFDESHIRYTITNLSGKTVYDEIELISNKPSEIDVRKFDSGLYLLTIRNKSYIQTQKIYKH